MLKSYRNTARISYLLLACLLYVALPARLAGHDIPNDVTLHVFIKPEGRVLRLFVRTPMKALRDVEFPKRGPGFLDLANAGPSLQDAAGLWLTRSFDVFEADAQLPPPALAGIRVSLPSDRSFESYEEVVEQFRAAPLPNDTQIMWDQALLDVALDYPIRSDRSEFAIRPQVARLGLRVVTALRFRTPDGATRPFEFAGDPGLVRLDPRWHQAALRFVHLGFVHILDGADHLLFLLCLVIPFRKFRPLLLIVTSFTVAHSVALFASAYGLVPDNLWFPPLVEALIALSIVYVAIENIVGTSLQRRWLAAFGFGLVHGFGFAFILRETFQFAGSHMLTSLVSFNAGAELGQILVIAALVPVVELAFRYAPERMGTIIISAFVAHTGWHWTLDRINILRQFRFHPPPFDWATAAVVARWLTVMVAFAALAWIAVLLQRRLVPHIRRWRA